MTLLQYTTEHYGKYLTQGDLSQRQKELELKSTYSPPQPDLPLLYLDRNYNIHHMGGLYNWGVPGNKQAKKFVLFELERVEIGHPRISALREKYIKVLTQSPEDEGDFPAQKQVWVRENWVEPLERHSTYEAEICARLLKKFK